MFEALFKYPLAYFSEGQLILALPGWQMVLAVPLIFVAVVLLLGYFRLRRGLDPRDLAAISLLRSLAIAVVLFSLSRPLLEVASTVAQPGVVGVLLDDSLSMQLRDDGAARRALVDAWFDAENGDLLRGLRERFDTRLFRFGADSAAIDSVDELEYADGASDLGAALRFARETLDGEPLAGLVVVSDGAAQSPSSLQTELLGLRAAGIPVYSIGVGAERYARDIELAAVQMPRQVLRGSRLVAAVTVTQQGYDGSTLELRVEDDNRIVHKQPIRLEAASQRFEVPLPAIDAGARQLKFSVAGQPGEKLTENNSRVAMLAVEGERQRILYYEGEPRFELKFLRRAVADDRQLAVSGLIRTADAKYYRVGIESTDELRDGFPTARDELFAYDALILGSVEVSLLDREQQQMIVDFVSQRGGGLLLLGGRHAFAEGGYQDSPLRDLLPLVIDAPPQADFSRRIKIRPTPAGLVHPALQLDEDAQKSADRWLTLPPLTTVNPVRRIKPGATLLLAGEAVDEAEDYVAMAFQRYGRGKVIAFAVQNSWLWQMHNEIDLEDQTHEMLWRQLLRWLVESVADRLELTLSEETLPVGGRLQIRGEILQTDPEAGATAAEPRAVLLSPTGAERVVPLVRDPARPGSFAAELGVDQPGDYRVHLEIDEAGETLRSAESRFVVDSAGSEYFDSQMNARLLGDLAAQTGGEFFTAERGDELPRALADAQRGARTLTRHELWDMPLLFALLVILLCAEWAWRRWRGLV